jgi:guanylate kinase
MTADAAPPMVDASPPSAQGQLFVVAAPSGAGKSSLVKALLEIDSKLGVSVSHTTRAPRGQDKNGREYWFVSAAEFDRMVKAGEFFEWAEVHGHCYGTSKLAIAGKLAAGQDVLLEIDWQGALQIRQIFPDAVLIFILPPSWEELKARLERRGEDAPDVIATRLTNARFEIAQVRHFRYVIINDSFERAVFDLKSVIHSQRLLLACQQARHPDVFADLATPPSA